jgi:kynurenine formamidase
MLGMDLPTPNQTDWIAAHTTLLQAEIVIVEALGHLDRVTVDEFFFIAAPLLILGCDGAPIRALGVM